MLNRNPFSSRSWVGKIRNSQSQTTKSIVLLLTAFFIFSIADAIVKLMSSDYAVLEIVTIRSAFALPIVILILLRSKLTFEHVKNATQPTQFWRGFAMFSAYLFFFLALAALPYSLMIGIFFAGPLFITMLSVPMLGEEVGWRRWTAVLVGFLGVLIIINPRGSTFEPATLLAIAAAFSYAISIILTRKMEDTAQVTAVWTNLVYLLFALILSPLFASLSFESVHPSIEFLTKAWTMPPLLDIGLIALLAIGWGGGMVLLSSAYRDAPVASLAPFEYFSMVYALLLGYLFWNEIPTLQMIAGVVLIIGSGLFIVYREQQLED